MKTNLLGKLFLAANKISFKYFNWKEGKQLRNRLAGTAMTYLKMKAYVWAKEINIWSVRKLTVTVSLFAIWESSGLLGSVPRQYIQLRIIFKYSERLRHSVHSLSISDSQAEILILQTLMDALMSLTSGRMFLKRN